MIRAIVAAVVAALALGAWTPALAEPTAMVLVEWALEHLKADRFDAVIAEAGAAIAMDPDMVPAYVLRGDAYQAKGDYVRALKDYSVAIKLDPGLSLARLNRGVAYVNLGEFANAVKDFEAAARDSSLEGKARGELSVALSGLGRHHEALREIDRAYRLKPSAEWLVVRGDILMAKGEPQKALEAFSEAIIDPGQKVAALAGRADAFFDLHDYPRAIADYEAALGQDPDRVTELNNLCWTRAVARLGLSQAEVACDRAVKLAPDDPLIYATRAYLRLALSRPDAALADAEFAARVDPDYADGRFLRAVALERLGRAAEASVEMSAALKLNPKIAETYAAHGMSTPEPGT